MSDKVWEELVDLIDTKYRVDKSETKEEPVEDSKNLKKKIEAIYFEKHDQKFKIERITGPRIVDKKTYYSGTGSANRVQYIYDPKETTSKVIFYRQSGNQNWDEISPEDLIAET